MITTLRAPLKTANRKRINLLWRVSPTSMPVVGRDQSATRPVFVKDQRERTTSAGHGPIHTAVHSTPARIDRLGEQDVAAARGAAGMNGASRAHTQQQQVRMYQNIWGSNAGKEAVEEDAEEIEAETRPKAHDDIKISEGGWRLDWYDLLRCTVTFAMHACMPYASVYARGRVG